MTPDVARLRELIRIMRELTNRLQCEVESVEEQESSFAVGEETRDRPVLRVVR